VYDTRATSGTLGYVLEQTLAAGRAQFEYEPIALAPGQLDDPDAPSLRVFETPPDGHVIERWFNVAGNQLLRREAFTEGGSRKQALGRTRYNADGAVIARMGPEGEITQSLYGREHTAAAAPWTNAPTTLSDITAIERQGFGNRLATIERAAPAVEPQ